MMVTMDNPTGLHALSILSENLHGVLRDVALVMANCGANIVSTQQSIIQSGPNKGRSSLFFEYEEAEDEELLLAGLRSIPAVIDVESNPPFSLVYGKRVLIFGGGAQVAQVALGAVNEADRHNIRGERISVDTIPLVGEQELATAVDAASHLPRVAVLVLAGSIMGGKISEAVDRVRKAGIPVISLSMVGSVPDHADLVVTDPIQAGVFAVMHASSKAVFTIDRVRGKRL